MESLIVFIGGGLGALSRWWLSGIVQRTSKSPLFPWGTLAVNIIGSLLLGFIMGATVIHGVFTRSQRLLLATGFAGALTTFSTFMYESLELLWNAPLLGFANILLSLLAGLASVYAGYVVGGLVYK